MPKQTFTRITWNLLELKKGSDTFEIVCKGEIDSREYHLYINGKLLQIFYKLHEAKKTAINWKA